MAQRQAKRPAKKAPAKKPAKPRARSAGGDRETHQSMRARHEIFARQIAMGASQTQAYMEAFGEKKIATAMSAASRLARDVNIKAQIRAFRKEIADRDADMMEYLQEEARDIYAIAKETGDLSAANRALQVLAILTGHWVEKRNVDGQVQFFVSDEPEETGEDAEQAWAAKHAKPGAGVSPASAAD